MAPVGLFSSMSLNPKYGVPDCSMMSSTAAKIGASWPHLKFDSSTATRFGCRAANLAAQSFVLLLAAMEFFQTSEMSSGCRIAPARTSSPNSRSSRSSSVGSVCCENTV